MAISVTMPQLGESVTEGTVTRWLKQVGDSVAVDEPLLEVSTDKVDTEIPSPAAGVLLSITAPQDSVVEVGGELAVIEVAAATPAVTPPAQWGPGADVDESVTTEIPIVDIPATFATAAEPATEDATPPPAASPLATPPPAASAAAATPAAPADPAPGAGASVAVVLPQLGESVTEGTVTRWLKNVGDSVAVDEPLLEVSTDKVDTEIPAPTAGILSSIIVAEDGVAAVGTILGTISPTMPAELANASPANDLGPSQPAAESTASTGPAESTGATVPASTNAPEAAATPPPVSESASELPHAPAAAQPEPVTAGMASPHATPLVRRLAVENGVDLASVVGTGVGGRIRKQDVLDAADQARTSAPAPAASAAVAPAPDVPPVARADDRADAAPSPVPVTRSAPGAQVPAVDAPRQRMDEAAESTLRGSTVRLSRLRRVIADRMLESLRVSAQLTSVVEVDLTRIAVMRTRVQRDFQSREGVKLTFLPFFAKATVDALKQFPTLNASLSPDGTEVTYHDAEHLGIAVDTDRGLLVPVVRDAGDLSIAGLARHIADLAERSRTGKVMPDELSGGTFTLTNTGSRGALIDTPIINQPQVAILGTGAVVKRPVVIPDESGADTIAVRSMAYLCLTYDHRIVDGADAARFLSAIKRRLEDGGFDADLGI
ncbi:MAG: 2-oxo acid dehydrogenase subunit E2 [Actinomycetales bacterium]|nr:2-oxo acid dehydrogenase subunit E2 [Actinomycetales bacterium]